MNSRFIWLHAITSIHVGAGQTSSLIDLPVIREATTDYPFLPGSGVKGALRDTFRLRRAAAKVQKGGLDAGLKDKDPRKAAAEAYAKAVRDADIETDNGTDPDTDTTVTRLFGTTDAAGALLIGDAKLAFLPLRSLEHAFVWVTCPYIIRRLQRDLKFIDRNIEIKDDLLYDLNRSSEDKALFFGSSVHVEDYRLELHSHCNDGDLNNLFGDFDLLGDNFFPESFSAAIWPHRSPLSEDPAKDSGRKKGLPGNLVIVKDTFFKYLATRRLPVRARNRLEPLYKTVAGPALWTEEALPPETLLYFIVADRSYSFAALADFEAQPIERLQIGANETVGEGWLELHTVREAKTP